ncbi:MAG: hypothetical protein U9P70_05450 [Patescibacteria group bacterium]|nr:hypothetical protein [Patescibacteria group bacterium]
MQTEFTKNFTKNNREKMFLLIGFFLVLLFGFFSGYFYLSSQIDKQGIVMVDANQNCKDLFNLKSVDDSSSFNLNSNSQVKGEQDKSENIILQNKTGAFVASKNSKIYHKPDCRYVKRIKEKNKVWFQSAKEAEDRGYIPHNCVE